MRHFYDNTVSLTFLQLRSWFLHRSTTHSNELYFCLHYIYNPLPLLSRMTTIGMPLYMSGCREGCAYGQANRPNPVFMEESNA